MDRADAAMIWLDHVFMEYPRSGLALEDVCLYLRPGEFCFLTGHSGAGKSTILRLIHMSERPTSGEVRVSGYRSGQVRSRDVAQLRRKVGFVFQDFRLLRDRTATQNVAFALEVTGARASAVRRRVHHLLGQVGLSGKADAYPGELSGGEQQRVAIARALANEPFVLLADEPTGNLDRKATASIFGLFREINAAGTAVVLATHALELIEAGRGYRVLELEQGRAVNDSGQAS